jgi:class 3 adenylate cyclase/tetratricopeptide (TPR) repeat protein
VSATGVLHSLPPLDEAEPELRRVTVLFADIEGSTALIQNLDPEEAASLIDPALRIMIDAAERFDGVVSGRGDGIMAIFGAPSASEDHGVRACLAALAIRDALADGRATESRSVRVRVGIHVGDVVFRPVRMGGSWSQDAVGIAVHIAARLEQSASPDTICLSGAAYRLAQGFVTATALEPITVKGVDAPIERYMLVEADRMANRWGVRAANGLARFVGRQHELATMYRGLEGDSLRLVRLVGGAGLGKSRLVHEFAGGEATRGCHVVSLVGDYHRRFVPFHPVATWLRGWLDIRAGDAMADARQKLARGLSALGGEAQVEHALLERILGLGGPGPNIASLTQITRVDFGAAVAGLLANLSGGRRTVLVCEDIDCFDAASGELLDSALRHMAGRNVMVVTASRTPRAVPAVPQSATITLTLAPLSDEHAAELLAGIDPALAANTALSATIMRKAGGNPLFLEEVAPLVAQQREGAVPELDDHGPVDIPDRVEALIADRLARLPRPLRRLLQHCAVIGVDVPLRLAGVLAGATIEELYPQLLQLQAEQLMYESRRYPDPQFSFKHALTRDVAYRTILAARRRSHHARIVEMLEREGEAERDRHLDDLCAHTIHAQLWPQAVRYLQLTANRAVDRAAYQLAGSYLTRALEITRTLEDDDGGARVRLDILLGLQLLHAHAGNYPRMSTCLDEAEQLSRRLNDHASRTRVHGLRVHVLNIMGRLEEARVLGEQTRTLARESDDTTLTLFSTFYLGQSLFNMGRLHEARDMLGENIDALSALPGMQQPRAAATVEVLSYGTRAMTLACLGDFTAAHADAAKMRHLSQDTARPPYDRVFSAAVTGFVHLQHRDLGPAEVAFRDGLARSEADGIAQLTPPLLTGLGHTLMRGKDLAAATELLSRAHRLSRDSQRAMFQISAATGLALSTIRLGEPDLALRFADEAVDLSVRFGFRTFQVAAVRAQGMAMAITDGMEDEGMRVLDNALDLAARLGMAAEIAHCHTVIAACTTGDPAPHLREAERRYAALGMGDWFAQRTSQLVIDGRPYR